MSASKPVMREDRNLSVVPSPEPTPVNTFVEPENEIEIDLIDLAFRLLDKVHYIIFACLLGAVLMNAYSYFMIAPTYQTTAKMYIVSASNDSVVDLTDLNIGTSLTKDYEELILSWPVLEQVIDELDLDMKYTDLANMITLSNPSDTRILNITVTSTEPEQARDIANTLTEVCKTYLPDTMSTAEPNIAQSAKLPTQKADPSYTKFTFIGAFLGILLCAGFYVIQYMMDDTIHNEEDMEKYFGIAPLTSIPEDESFSPDDRIMKKKKAAAAKKKKQTKAKKRGKK